MYCQGHRKERRTLQSWPASLFLTQKESGDLAALPSCCVEAVPGASFLLSWQCGPGR